MGFEREPATTVRTTDMASADISRRIQHSYRSGRRRSKIVVIRLGLCDINMASKLPHRRRDRPTTSSTQTCYFYGRGLAYPKLVILAVPLRRSIPGQICLPTLARLQQRTQRQQKQTWYFSIPPKKKRSKSSTLGQASHSWFITSFRFRSSVTTGKFLTRLLKHPSTHSTSTMSGILEFL